jgi:hypothetical protein
MGSFQSLRSGLADCALTRELRADSVRIPDYLLAWWAELGINSRTANLTHVIWRVRGAQCAARFREAVRRAAARHALLRSKVVRRDGGLYFDLRAPCDITEVSIAPGGGLTDSHADPRQQRAIDSAVWTPLADGTVFRPFLIALSPLEAVCGFVLHHFVADYYACQVLAREIRSDMLGECDRMARPTRAPLQYADYLRGMSEWVTGAEATHRLSYWRQCMRDAPATCLPAEGADADSVAPLQRLEFELPMTLRDGLASAARSCQSTLASIVMSANYIALAAELQQQDLVATVLVSGRDTAALLGMVGSTADCIPLRVWVAPETSFQAFVREVQEKLVLGCRKRVKWELVQAAMRDVNASGIAPTFNFIIDADNPVIAAGREPLLSIEPIDAGDVPELGSAALHASHDMNLYDTGQVVQAHLKYMPLRHSRNAMTAFVARFLRCLTAIAADPFAPVDRLIAS